jgi:hypothetical protein
VRIVRELADEGNSIAKIAFMTRLTESVVREALSLLASSKATPYPGSPGVSGQYLSPTQRASRRVTAGRPLRDPNPEGTWLWKKSGQAQGPATGG